MQTSRESTLMKTNGRKGLQVTLPELWPLITKSRNGVVAGGLNCWLTFCQLTDCAGSASSLPACQQTCWLAGFEALHVAGLLTCRAGPQWISSLELARQTMVGELLWIHVGSSAIRGIRRCRKMNLGATITMIPYLYLLTALLWHMSFSTFDFMCIVL